MFSDIQNVLFPPLGRNQGCIERKHMMAIFHGMSWLNFPELTCLLGFHSIANRDWEKEMGAFTFLKPLLGNGVTVRDLSQLGWPWTQSLLPQKSSLLQTQFPGAWRHWLLQQTPSQCPSALVVMVFCCVRHCWGSTICSDSGSSFLVLFAVGIWLKLKSIPLGH